MGWAWGVGITVIQGKDYDLTASAYPSCPPIN